MGRRAELTYVVSLEGRISVNLLSPASKGAAAGGVDFFFLELEKQKNWKRAPGRQIGIHKAHRGKTKSPSGLCD